MIKTTPLNKLYYKNSYGFLNTSQCQEHSLKSPSARTHIILSTTQLHVHNRQRHGEVGLPNQYLMHLRSVSETEAFSRVLYHQEGHNKRTDSVEEAAGS